MIGWANRVHADINQDRERVIELLLSEEEKPVADTNCRRRLLRGGYAVDRLFRAVQIKKKEGQARLNSRFVDVWKKWLAAVVHEEKNNPLFK